MTTTKQISFIFAKNNEEKIMAEMTEDIVDIKDVAIAMQIGFSIKRNKRGDIKVILDDDYKERLKEIVTAKIISERQ